MEIYGINVDKELTALMVRDALVNCFIDAHCDDVGLTGIEKESNRNYCGDLVRKMFIDVGGDFNQPTKADLEKVLNKLAEFSKSFRNPELIKKHHQEMKDLLERLP